MHRAGTQIQLGSALAGAYPRACYWTWRFS